MPCSSRPLQFLSTPSARRATSFCIRPSTLGIHFYPRPPRGGRPITCARVHVNIRYFYPRPPRGGRHNDVDKFIASFDFYPRPPRGGRHGKNPDINYILQFLSTPSARRATQRQCSSVHVPRYFYPRPPRGGRLEFLEASDLSRLFLSTPSARRATQDL